MQVLVLVLQFWSMRASNICLKTLGFYIFDWFSFLKEKSQTFAFPNQSIFSMDDFPTMVFNTVFDLHSSMFIIVVDLKQGTAVPTALLPHSIFHLLEMVRSPFL